MRNRDATSGADIKNPGGVPGTPSDTDTPENLSMGSSTSDNSTARQ